MYHTQLDKNEGMKIVAQSVEELVTYRQIVEVCGEPLHHHNNNKNLMNNRRKGKMLIIEMLHRNLLSKKVLLNPRQLRKMITILAL